MVQWQYAEVEYSPGTPGVVTWFYNYTGEPQLHTLKKERKEHASHVVRNRLAQLGLEGWEIVSVLGLGVSGYSAESCLFYLKRPVPSQ